MILQLNWLNTGCKNLQLRLFFCYFAFQFIANSLIISDMKKRSLTIFATMVATVAILAATVQTLNVRLGEVIFQYATDQVGRMNLSESGTVATILNKVFNLNEVDEMYLDETPVTDNMVYVDYDGTTAQVRVAAMTWAR